MNCLNCDKELVNLMGKRQKQFCNSTCRSNYWQKTNRIAKVKKDIKKEANKLPEPPKELTGIELTIWKSKNNYYGTKRTT